MHCCAPLLDPEDLSSPSLILTLRVEGTQILHMQYTHIVHIQYTHIVHKQYTHVVTGDHIATSTYTDAFHKYVYIIRTYIYVKIHVETHTYVYTSMCTVNFGG